MKWTKTSNGDYVSDWRDKVPFWLAVRTTTKSRGWDIWLCNHTSQAARKWIGSVQRLKDVEGLIKTMQHLNLKIRW